MSDTITYKSLTNQDFSQFVIKEKQSSILVFGATWSGNAEIMDSMMERVSAEYSTEIQFFKIDIEEQKGIADFFNIYSVPTILMMKDGEIVELIRGFASASKIRRIIDKVYLNQP